VVRVALTIENIIVVPRIVSIQNCGPRLDIKFCMHVLTHVLFTMPIKI